MMRYRAKADALRVIGGVAEQFAAMFVVGFVVALEPCYPAVAFKSQDMGGHTVQKPAVMTDDHRAAAEVDDCFFECAQGVDVKVVGRFIQKQEIAAATQQFGEMHPIALST